MFSQEETRLLGCDFVVLFSLLLGQLGWGLLAFKDERGHVWRGEEERGGRGLEGEGVPNIYSGITEPSGPLGCPDLPSTKAVVHKLELRTLQVPKFVMGEVFPCSWSFFLAYS